MGYERKRGKLAALNAFLRGGSGDSFSVVVGAIAVLADVKYVITLDTDTQMPRDSAWQSGGSHGAPLEPGAILRRQPACLPGVRHPRPPRPAARLEPPSGKEPVADAQLGSDPGIDPYTQAVSDVYQDLVQEGSFIGKGIYEVDAFERALNGRFPENRILSHDLLEGCYARAGLLSDVQLYEEYPARYSADVIRRYRWIRGDWQITPWLLPWVPGPGRPRKNPLSALSRWKIFDNLRRSLVAGGVDAPVAPGLDGLVIGLVLGPWRCSASCFIPPVSASMLRSVPKSRGTCVRASISLPYAAPLAGTSLRRPLPLLVPPRMRPFSVSMLSSAPASRILITHKRLLEWNPSGDGERA